MSNNAHELSNRLLNALDNNYNVVDMHTVNEIISILEKINITKELLETTRLGKHVNELRRKTTEPTLARRAKVLVKRWRDLVIPNVASPGHTGSNRSSAERQIRRLGGTPLTSPALTRQGLSPAVPSPRPPSRPAWGGYESDSQDVILVDDEPPPPPVPNPLTNTHKPITPPVKRPPSPELLHDEKKAKRDKKPKKRRGHSRAGTETPAPPPEGPWGGRNGTTHERRRNGTRQPLDSYAALVNRMPPAGAKKVKTTKELLEQIQSRGTKPATSPGSPRSPASPDVMLIEPDAPAAVKVESPLRNGGKSPRAESPYVPCEPLEDERDYPECTCGAEEGAGDEACPAAVRTLVRPASVHALHHALLPGINGTRAPLHPHRFAVRPPEDPDRPGLFTSVVPLYKYSDYADDHCVKNMARVPLCTHLPWTEFAPPPPDLPPPPSPPPIRPYPVEEPVKEEPADDDDDDEKPNIHQELVKKEAIVNPAPLEAVQAEMVGVPMLEPSERLKAPLLTAEDETAWSPAAQPSSGATLSPGVSVPAHRTVERTKPGGAMLREAVASAIRAVPYDYDQLDAAPVLSADSLATDDGVRTALAEATVERDSMGRPVRSTRFAEWHECAQLGSLTALPYVVID